MISSHIGQSNQHTPDPAIIYESVTENPDRLANIKNLTLFYDDLANNKLPQWMFITPNMSQSSQAVVV